MEGLGMSVQMNHQIVKRSQRGVGLVEVLIAMLVVAAGVLALAKFQSTVTSESRYNKARSEAKSLCEQKIAQYRTPLTNAEFVTFTTDAADDTEITGQLNQITFNTTVTDISATEKRVNISCSWGTEANETVTLETVVSPHLGVTSALYAGSNSGNGAGAISPSLNAGSSDDAAIVRKILPDADGIVTAGQKLEEVTIQNSEGETVSGYYFVDASLTTASFGSECPAGVTEWSDANQTLAALRINARGDANYLESLKLFEVITDNDVKYCIDRVRYNGGVIVKIDGIVHSNLPAISGGYLPLELFTFNISESGTYCTFNPTENDTSRQYACYVGGNCSNTYPLITDPTDQNYIDPTASNYPVGDSDIFKCPELAPTSIEDEWGGVGEGGWRGRVGLLNVANFGYNACFYEELYTDTDSTRDTARDYFTRYKGVANNSLDDRNQGINKPYTCQDFLIIKGVNNPNHSALRKACQAAAESVGGLYLATKTVNRPLESLEKNYFDASVGSSYCDKPFSYTVTGNIAGGQVGYPDIRVIDEAGVVWLCDVTSGSFTCSVNTTNSSALLDVVGFQGTPNEGNDSCNDINLSAYNDGDIITGCTITFSTQTPVHTLKGTLTGSEVGTNIGNENGLEEITIQDSNGYTYGCEVGDYVDVVPGREFKCEFVKSADVNTLNNVFISTNTGYTASPSTELDIALSDTVTTSLATNFVINDPTSPTTYTLSGSFTLAAGVSSNPAINPDGNSDSNSCTLTPPGQNWNGNNERVGSYSCVLEEGDRNVTVTIADTCEGDNGNNVGTKVEIEFDGNNQNYGSYSFDEYVGENLTNKHIVISVSEVACNN